MTNLENGEAGSQGSTGLQPIAEGKDKFLGNTYSGSQIQGFANYWNKVSEEKLHQICDQIDAIVEPLIKRTDENWAPTTREAVLDQFVRSVSIVI